MLGGLLCRVFGGVLRGRLFLVEIVDLFGLQRDRERRLRFIFFRQAGEFLGRRVWVCRAARRGVHHGILGMMVPAQHGIVSFTVAFIVAVGLVVDVVVLVVECVVIIGGRGDLVLLIFLVVFKVLRLFVVLVVEFGVFLFIGQGVSLHFIVHPHPNLLVPDTSIPDTSHRCAVPFGFTRCSIGCSKAASAIHRYGAPQIVRWQEELFRAHCCEHGGTRCMVCMRADSARVRNAHRAQAARAMRDARRSITHKKKRRHLEWAASEIFGALRRSLEDDLQAELRIEGFACADARRSVVVADGVVQGEVTAC